jgi:hypothetical protein
MINDEHKAAILSAWNRRQAAAEINSPPAQETELAAFEAEFGPIPPDFRWFLSSCGGGPVGSEWVDDIHQLGNSHRKFQSEAGPGGWALKDVFVIGWDGGGNPFGIHRPTGHVLVDDHHFDRNVKMMSPSFEHLLIKGLCSESE